MMKKKKQGGALRGMSSHDLKFFADTEFFDAIPDEAKGKLRGRC
jgi:hypothetical protein